MSYELLLGDAVEVMRTLPANSCQVCVTSPPYFGLRSYLDSDHEDKRLEIGLEETPEAYVAKLVEVFREVRRVLHPSGVVFLNLGDSYNGSGGAGGDYAKGGLKEGQPKYPGRNVSGLKPKDLIGIPWMTAFALRADGWWLRSAITWCKANPMPESCTDRCTSATEMVFMLAKSQTYFYDQVAIAEPASMSSGYAKQRLNGVANWAHRPGIDVNGGNQGENKVWQDTGTRNKRNWWAINSEAYPGSHFATMPTKLVEPCILAGTSAYGCCAACGSPWQRVVEREKPDVTPPTIEPQRYDGLGKQRGLDKTSTAHTPGWRERPPESAKTLGWQPTCPCGAAAAVAPCTVLDPFCGSGTTVAVALKHGRNGIAIDLNADYLELAHDRIRKSQPMLLSVTP